MQEHVISTLSEIISLKERDIDVNSYKNEEVNKVNVSTEKNLVKDYKVNTTYLKNPHIKIVGIEREMKRDELLETIKNQNIFLNHPSFCLIIKVIKKMRDKWMAIIECDPESFMKILAENGLFIDWSKCRVYEYVKVSRCFGCGGFGNKAHEYTNKSLCIYCVQSMKSKTNMERQHMLDFDEMLEEIGEMGKFQIYNYILVCLPILFAAANSLSYVFTAGVPDYRCFIPECEDPHNTSYNTPWLKWVVPTDDGSDKVIGVKKDICTRYAVNQSLINNTCTKDIFTNVTETCSEWIFDDSERTIVNDWNITCEKEWMVSLVGTSHFAGIVVGSFAFGVLADWYGRKIVFVLCIFIMSISGAAQVLSPGYIVFVFLIFVNSLGTAGVYPLAFIIGVEMVGKKKREVTGIILNYFYAVGEAIVAPIAWYTRDWVLVQLLVSLPALIFIAYYWLIPESVRWLLANEKRDKAKIIVFKAAKVNKVVLSDSLLDSFKEESPLTGKGEMEKEREKILPVVKQIVTSKKLILRFLIIYFVWAVNAFVYYGLSINSTSLGGNKYVNFTLVSLIEIPGYSLAWICIQKLGRRISLVGSLLLCGATCTLTIFATNISQSNWEVITLFLLGKLGVTSAFGVVYVYTAEMLPTIVRSGGVGTASTVARLGALLAPMVPLLGRYYTPLPMLLFGGVAILAGLLAIKLPETYGTKLPETVEEAEQI